jgi:hypothetical protein
MFIFYSVKKSESWLEKISAPNIHNFLRSTKLADHGFLHEKKNNLLKSQDFLARFMGLHI